MPIENLGKNHFTDAEKQELNAAITVILNIITPKTYNLSPKERSKYGKVGEQAKLLLNAVKKMQDDQPELASPDVNWDEFNADYTTRGYAEMTYLKLQSAMQMVLNIKILHDHDNLTDALRDYNYTTYKAGTGNPSGYAGKAAILKEFFPKTGKTKKKE